MRTRTKKQRRKRWTLLRQRELFRDREKARNLRGLKELQEKESKSSRDELEHATSRIYSQRAKEREREKVSESESKTTRAPRHRYTIFLLLPLLLLLLPIQPQLRVCSTAAAETSPPTRSLILSYAELLSVCLFLSLALSLPQYQRREARSSAA